MKYKNIWNKLLSDLHKQFIYLVKKWKNKGSIRLLVIHIPTNSQEKFLNIGRLFRNFELNYGRRVRRYVV